MMNVNELECIKSFSSTMYNNIREKHGCLYNLDEDTIAVMEFLEDIENKSNTLLCNLKKLKEYKSIFLWA